MASTTTVTATETIYAKIITDQLIDAVYSAAFMHSLMRNESLIGQASETYSFPVWPSMTAASVAETDEVTSTAIDTTNVDISVSEGAALRVDLTDRLTESTVVRDASQFAAQAGKAVADKRDADAAALLAGFSTVRDAGVSATDDLILDGVQDLQVADAPAPFAAVLAPKQVGQLRKDIVQSAAAVLTNRSDMEFAPKRGLEYGYIGIPIYGTSNTPTSDVGANLAGAIFSLGQALGFVEKRPIRMEPERDASFRLTEYVLTSVYGQGELVDSWGVTLKSDV